MNTSDKILVSLLFLLSAFFMMLTPADGCPLSLWLFAMILTKGAAFGLGFLAARFMRQARKNPRL